VAVLANAGRDGGFDSDNAYLLRSKNVAPRSAAQLRQPGLSDSALVSLIEDALFRHRLSRDDLAVALPWLAAGFDPAAATAWRDSGFDLAAAQCWRDEHFGVKQAAEWRRLGDSPASAREVAERFQRMGVTVAEALRFLDRGLTVDEICEPRRTNATRA
jgi:hypothetical protein